MGGGRGRARAREERPQRSVTHVDLPLPRLAVAVDVGQLHRDTLEATKTTKGRGLTHFPISWCRVTGHESWATMSCLTSSLEVKRDWDAHSPGDPGQSGAPIRGAACSAQRWRRPLARGCTHIASCPTSKALPPQGAPCLGSSSVLRPPFLLPLPLFIGHHNN